MDTSIKTSKQSSDDWPPRFHCNVPGLFSALAKEGYGLILAPLLGDLNSIAKRAIELEDQKLLNLLGKMGLLDVSEEKD